MQLLIGRFFRQVEFFCSSKNAARPVKDESNQPEPATIQSATNPLVTASVLHKPKQLRRSRTQPRCICRHQHDNSKLPSIRRLQLDRHQLLGQRPAVSPWEKHKSTAIQNGPGLLCDQRLNTTVDWQHPAGSAPAEPDTGRGLLFTLNMNITTKQIRLLDIRLCSAPASRLV